MFINSRIALFINGVYLAFINTPDIEHVIPGELSQDITKSVKTSIPLGTAKLPEKMSSFKSFLNQIEDK